MVKNLKKELLLDESDNLSRLQSRLDVIKKEFSCISINEIENSKELFLDERLYCKRMGGGYHKRFFLNQIKKNTEKWFKKLDTDKLMRILSTSLIEKEIKNKEYLNFIDDIDKTIKWRKNQILLTQEELNKKEGLFEFIFVSSVKQFEKKVELHNYIIMQEELIKVSEKERIETKKYLAEKTITLTHLINLAEKYTEEINNIDNQIKKIKSAISNKQKKSILDSKLSKAAAIDNKLRQDIYKFKSRIKVTINCPYCNELLGNDIHLDHIYPVAKGGLNIEENLVYCCQKCNALKSSKSLKIFCNLNNLDYSEITERLHKLGKHV